MTEAEWMACADPRKMLQYCEGLLSDRKKRLYLVACCRSIWNHMKTDASRRAVVVAERFADGLASADELQQAYATARSASDPAWYWTYRNHGHPQMAAVQRAASAAVGAVNAAAPMWAVNAGPNTAWAVGHNESPPCVQEMRHQADIIRCILGNPFRSLAFDPTWLTSTVVALASQMYESRDFSAMPILTDALQDAGCDSADVLDHCRGPAPHVRGCWVVDLLLGKS